MRKIKKTNPRWGSSFDYFLKEEGIYDQVVAQATMELKQYRTSKGDRSASKKARTA